MFEKKLPFTKDKILEIAEKYPTPFHLYDERAIRETSRSLTRAFSWNPGFKEYFAVKASPNPFLIKILVSEGFGVDCSSMAELALAERVGLQGEDIMFSSNNTPAEEFQRARALGAIVNLDDISHISVLERRAGLSDVLCLRYNPGSLKTGNLIIGQPLDSKFGVTREQLTEGYRTMRDAGVSRFGLHAMVASNELDPDYFIETAEVLFRTILQLSRELGIRFEFVNIGGGLGIPYEPGQVDLDLNVLSRGIRQHYGSIILDNALKPLKIYMECGRFITGPSGYLITRVRHIKQTYKNFAGLDSCMADLMRAAMYGAYHHITVLGKEGAAHDQLYDVTGSLCENNDKFAIDRMLPQLEIGDLLVIHDTGAHGHAMGFNYNGRLRSSELLLRDDGEVVLIRSAETIEDYFSTLDFDALKHFIT
jgi:diaminopimelate decarboxylase